MSLPLASRTLYFVLSIATIVMNGFMSLTYYTSKALQVHPQSLLQCISILEVVAAYHTVIWVINITDNSDDSMLSEVISTISGNKIETHEAVVLLCGVNQILLTVSITGIICYNTAMCLDLVISLWRPIFSVNKRLLLYHSLTFLAIVYFTVYIDFVDNYITLCSPTKENSIQIINSGSVIILLIVYVAVAPLSILYACYRIYSSSALFSKKKRDWLIRYIIYTSCFVMAWVWAFISYWYSDSGVADDTLNLICIVMVSSSGCLLAVIRVSEPIFCKELCAYLKTWRPRELDEENMPLSAQIQTEQLQELFHIILSSLCHAWSNIELEGSTLQDFHQTRVHRNFDSMSQSIEVWGQKLEASPEVTLVEYSPAIFSQIKENSNVFNSNLFTAFSPLHNAEGIKKASEGDGKSGSFILLSSNRLFLMKTISQKELKYFTSQMLPAYYGHLKTYKDSLICKIYGAFTLDCPGMEDINVIIMENVMPKSYAKLFDLKGSTVNRKAKGNSKVGKDLDFLEYLDNYPVEMEIEQSEVLRKQLVLDTNLLMSLKVMDYSLLFAVSKERQGVHVVPSACRQLYFHFGVIDFMIHYGKMKSMETIFKTLQMPHKYRMISAVNSNEYAQRFIKFMLAAFNPPDKTSSFVSLN